MKKNNAFILPKKLLVALSGFGFAMWFGAYFHFRENREGFNWSLGFAFLFTLITAIAAAIHVIKNPDEERNYWLGSFVLVPFISPLIYFISQKEQ